MYGDGQSLTEQVPTDATITDASSPFLGPAGGPGEPGGGGPPISEGIMGGGGAGDAEAHTAAMAIKAMERDRIVKSCSG